MSVHFPLVLYPKPWHNERVETSWHAVSRDELITELEWQEHEIERLRRERDETERDIEQLRRDRDRLRQERDRLRRKIDRLEKNSTWRGVLCIDKPRRFRVEIRGVTRDHRDVEPVRPMVVKRTVWHLGAWMRDTRLRCPMRVRTAAGGSV